MAVTKSTIRWETTMTTALRRAKEENKTILLDFYNPGWIGCQQMDAVTYPDEMVAGLINDSLIPLRVPHNDKPLSVDFNVQWTPSIMILDVDGREHHRTLGFLAPEEFIPSLLLGVAKSHLDRGELEDADRILDKLLFDFPRSDSSPEALYLFGVTKYKISHDASVLKDVYERLVAEYPGSVWTKRAHPYSLLWYYKNIL